MTRESFRHPRQAPGQRTKEKRGKGGFFPNHPKKKKMGQLTSPAR